MEWAKANIPEGERIFNCNWDDFPKMFFLDTKHSYVYGLDPNYLYTENPELYRLVKDITGGEIDDPAPIIREKFGTRWIFSDARENETFIAKILESGWADTVYEDGEAYILRIRDVKGEPPPETDVAPPNAEEQEQLEQEEETDEANRINEENINTNNELLEEDDSDLDEPADDEELEEEEIPEEE